jgi:hypothetical protein
MSTSKPYLARALALSPAFSYTSHGHNLRFLEGLKLLVLTDSGVTGDSLPSKPRLGDYAASCRDRRTH